MKKHPQLLFAFLLPGLLFTSLSLNSPDSLQSHSFVLKESRKDIAVFFAIDSYPQNDWEDLRNPIHDSETLARILWDFYDFDTLIYRNPSKSEIERNLFYLQDQAYQEKDQLFIFFSGHGELNPRYNKGMFVSSPSKASKGDEKFDFEDIGKIVDLIPCKHILLAIDACYSGMIFQEIRTKGNRELETEMDKIRFIDKQLAFPSRYVVTSGGKEVTYDGGKHSPFARAIISGLRYTYTASFKGFSDGCYTFYDLLSSLEGVNNPRPRFGELAGHEDGGFVFIAKSRKTEAIPDTLTLNNKKPTSRSKRSPNPVRPKFGSNKNKKNRLAQKDLPQEPKMIRIPSGEFFMGNDDYESEAPKHHVYVSEFSIAETEITVAQYLRFATALNDHFPEWYEPGTDRDIKVQVDRKYRILGPNLNQLDHPIIGISWEDAVAYCNWLSQITGKKYRLPTEAEWEYAARAGQIEHQFSGSKDVHNLANYAWHTTNARGNIQRVKSLFPNDYTLYDMSGNVSEWCLDSWHRDYSKAPEKGENAWIDRSQKEKIVRGGSWMDDATILRISYRKALPEDYRSNFIGFRPVRVP